MGMIKRDAREGLTQVVGRTDSLLSLRGSLVVAAMGGECSQQVQR